MSGQGTAKAADYDAYVQTGHGGALTRSDKPATAAKAQKRVEGGRLAIRQAIGELFLALKAALDRNDPNLLAKPGSPLTELARAFSRWLNANLPRPSGKID